MTELLLDPAEGHKKFCLKPQNNFLNTRKSPKLMLPLFYRLFTESSAEIVLLCKG